VGEGSSTYLTSRPAPARIAELIPDVKFVVMLRDPVSRTYSHYWHLVRNGTALFDFETTLERARETLVKRSRYAPAIRRYFEEFDQEQFKFVIFERFCENQQKVVDEICEFLGLAPTLEVEALTTHKNAGGAPISVAGKLIQNRLFSRHADLTSIRGVLSHLPDAPSWEEVQKNRGLRGLATVLVRNRGVAWLERRLGSSDYPPMEEETEGFLQKLLVRENRGLSELIDIDVSQFWPYFADGES
jgi:hypothetical protein